MDIVKRIKEEFKNESEFKVSFLPEKSGGGLARPKTTYKIAYIPSYCSERRLSLFVSLKEVPALLPTCRTICKYLDQFKGSIYHLENATDFIDYKGRLYIKFKNMDYTFYDVTEKEPVSKGRELYSSLMRISKK